MFKYEFEEKLFFVVKEIFDVEKNRFIDREHSCSIGKVSIFNEEVLDINLGNKILDFIK